jgi:hypothetical protein
MTRPPAARPRSSPACRTDRQTFSLFFIGFFIVSWVKKNPKKPPKKTPRKEKVIFWRSGEAFSKQKKKHDLF